MEGWTRTGERQLHMNLIRCLTGKPCLMKEAKIKMDRRVRQK